MTSNLHTKIFKSENLALLEIDAEEWLSRIQEQFTRIEVTNMNFTQMDISNEDGQATQYALVLMYRFCW